MVEQDGHLPLCESLLHGPAPSNAVNVVARCANAWKRVSSAMVRRSLKQWGLRETSVQPTSRPSRNPALPELSPADSLA